MEGSLASIKGTKHNVRSGGILPKKIFLIRTLEKLHLLLTFGHKFSLYYIACAKYVVVPSLFPSIFKAFIYL